jgi:hypothetical protein
MSYWIKGNDTDLGKILVSWRHRSVSRMFIRILTWLLMAFVLSLLFAIVAAPFDPHDNVHPFVRSFFFLVLLYGIISAFLGNVYQGQQYSISERALISNQPIWKGGFLMVWLRVRLGIAHKYIEHLPWDKISNVSKADKHMQIEFSDDGNLSIAVSPVLEFVRVGESGKMVTRRIDGFWARLFEDNKKLNSNAMQHIMETARSLSQTQQQGSGSKKKRK